MVENQEQTTETILPKTSSIAEPDEHCETVIKNYEDENVKDHVEGDNIDNVPSVGKDSRVKLLSSSSELNTTVEICGMTEVSESLDEKETEDQVSKSMGVKETEGPLSKSSDESKIESPQVEKGNRDFSEEVQLITKETVGEGYREHNGGTEVAEVYESENKVENLSTASITLDDTEKITDIEKETFEDHTFEDHRSQTFPEEEPCHIISYGMAEKELHMVSASEDVRSNPEEVELRGDTKEEITKNEKIGCDAPINVTLQSNSLSASNKEEAERFEEMNDTPIEETCVAGFRSEAIESSSGIKEIASLDGQSEKPRNEEINNKESPREARTDETIDASSTAEKPPFHEKNVSAANIDEEDEIHLYDKGKGQQDAPPLVHEIEASEGTHSEGTQLSVEEPKVMHDIDEADKELDSSDLGLPLTEEASHKDLAPPCQIDGDNRETNTEDEEQNADSLVESHNLSIPNDANSKVTKEEIEFDSSSTTLSEEKRDELNVQESEQRKDPQMEGNSEATGLRDGKESDMNDSINENSKLEVFQKSTSTTEPDEHPDSVPKLYEAENVKASNIESSHGANFDESSSVGNAPSEKLLSSSLELNKATETENGTEQISKSLEGKEIHGQVLEGSDRTETEIRASESSEGKETEDCDKKSSDGKEYQDHHVVEGEWKSTQEIQTITEKILGEGYKGTNGGIAPDGTDTNSHQSEHEESQLTGENNVENITRDIVLDNTEKSTSVEPVTFEDHLHRPSVEENSSHTISLSMVREYVPSTSEDLLADLEDIESTAMEEEIINQEEIGHGATVNMTLESDHLSYTNKEDMEKNEETNSGLGSALSVAHIDQTCFTSSTEANVSSLGVNDIPSLGEQSETEGKARNTEINLPEVPTEAREDETIDASSEQENQPLDGKLISADDAKEEDGTNQHNTSKDQPDTHPLVHETEVCEENQVSAEKTGKRDDIDEADKRDQHDTTKVHPDTPPLVHEKQVCEENQVSLLDEQSETEEKARNTEINLPEVQPEAKEDETTDASSDQETQPFDAKAIAADDLKEEDKTNQHGTTKGQPDTLPLVQETEVCEENQISAEELREMHDVDEADRRDQHETTQCQLDTNQHGTTKGHPDTPLLVHEIEVCKENQVSLLDEQSKTEEQARNTKTNLREVPTEAKEDETIEENEPFDGKNISADDLKEEDGTNQHDISKDQPDTRPRVHETEVCEEIKGSAEETGKTVDVDEADRIDQHDTTKVQPDTIEHDTTKSQQDTPPLVHEKEVCEDNQVSLPNEQSGTEEKARIREINLQEAPTEAKEDETTDASSDQETQPFDAKTIAADDLKEEDRTNQHGTTKGQQDTLPLVQETEICEENQISAEELREAHDVDEADRRDQHETTQCQSDTNQHDITKGHPDTPPLVHVVSLLDEQSKTEEQARNTITNFPEGPTDAKEDETIDASSAQESQPFDGKNISAADLKEEDGTNQHDTSKDQPDTPSLVHETEICEENQVSAEETGKTIDIDEADRRDKHDTTKVQPDTKEHDTTKGQPDTPPLVHETEVCEEDQGSLLDEQSEIEEKARNTDIHLPEVPTEANEDETIDASRAQENQSFDGKTTSADDLKVEDRTNQHGTTKGQPDTPPLVYETEVCEETQDFAEEAGETYDVDEADGRDQHDTTKGQPDLNQHDTTKGQPDTPSLVHETEVCEENQVSILSEQSETEEKAQNTEIHLPEVPTEAKEDETIDALGNEPFDGKNISPDDLKEEDRTIQHGTTKGQLDAPPLVHEIEVCEENQVSAEELGETHDTDDADMKSISLQNIENKDSDEKPEETVTQPADNSNTENESSTAEVAPETTGDKEHVQDLSIISQQTIDTMDLDEKSKERILAENSNTEQECSTIEVLKETTGDKEHIQDMTNMIFKKTEDTSSHNFMKDADDFNDNADVLVKKESSLKDVHIDEKTFNVYGADIHDELPLRMNSSSKKDEQVEIRQLETTSGLVYQTEPSVTKEIITEMIQMEKPNLNEGSTDLESKTPNEQGDNTDKSQPIQGGKEEIYGIVHGINGNVEVGHITSSHEKEEATNELQEMCVVQPMGEQEHETLDSIKEIINEGGIDVGVSSMISSEEKCLLNNDSNTLELRLPSVEGMSDRGRMEEENIHKEKSEETGPETSSPDHSCLTSENSTKDVDHLSVSEGTVTIDELQESKEATDLKSDMSPTVLESETKLHHAEVLSETKKGAIKEESLQAEIGAVNISKEERTELGSVENNISMEKVTDEGTSNLEREDIPEEPQSITIEDSSDTTNKENNIEKVTECDINIMQSEKDRGDNEYEKSFKSNLQGEKRSISDDFLLTDVPGLSKGGENKEFLVEGDKPAQESSLGTSEDIRKNIIYDETNEKDEDQVTLAADTSDVKVNEVTGHHSITDEDHSKVQDLWLEKDIEMMPESEKTTVQIETQRQQTADDSNAVPRATNLNPELKCTSDESITIERESTTIRPVDESTLDLTQGPTYNDRFAADKRESLAQLSELHDDHAITNEAEREDPLEHESSNNIKFEIKNSGNLAVSSDKDIEERDPGESTLTISSKYKDIPLLESVSTAVIDIEEVKQIDPCEAVPEPNSTGSSEKEASHYHEETADSPMRASDLGHGFAEDNIHETGDAASQDQHGNHVIQHVQESSIRSQEGSIDDVDGTQQTADLSIATLSASEALSIPEVDRLMLSTPKDSKDDPKIQEKIAAEDIRVRREILECAESSFAEIKDEGDRITDEPEETTEKLLPAEMSAESTWEKADHPGETSKLKTQQAGTEVKPEEAEVEKEKYNERKEGNSASGVIFICEKVPDEDTNEIIAGEAKDMSSTIYSNEIISVQLDPEECTEILINREGVELKTDEAKVEEKEQDWQKESRSGSEVQLMGEKDPGYDTSNKITTSQMDCSSNMRMSEIILSGGNSADPDESTAEKENQDGWKGDNTVSEALPVSEKDADGHNIDRSIVAEMKDGTSSATPDDWILVQVSQEDHTEKTTYSEDKEIKTDQDETVEEQDVPKEGNPGAGVPLTGEEDPDYHTSKRTTKTEMKDESPSAEPIYMTLVNENPGDCTTTVIFSGDKEVKAEGATVVTGDQDVQKEEKSDSEVPVVGVTYAEKEKVTPVSTSEAVAQSERLEPDEEKRSSHDYREIQDALGSTLASKISQTNQGQDYDEEAKLNAAKIEAPEPECAELGSKPENNNINKKTTTKEPEEGNKLPSEKETPLVDHISIGHFSEAKKEDVQEENTGRKEDSKAVKIPEHKNKEDEEVKEHEEENTELRVRTEASRDSEVKVSPKKSHNLFSGVIKNSISKMKKAITCTNSQLMPQSPR